MKKHLSKKRVVLAAIVVVALAIASGVAYAYWTSTGSGPGTASAATSIAGITVNQTGTPLSAMYPGLAAQTLHGDFTNSTSGPVYVVAVTASISSVDKAIDAPAGTCDDTDFTLGGAAPVNAEVPVGSPSTATWSGLTIQFKDKALVNQNSCKGATVHLTYATTAS